VRITALSWVANSLPASPALSPHVLRIRYRTVKAISNSASSPTLVCPSRCRSRADVGEKRRPLSNVVTRRSRIRGVRYRIEQLSDAAVHALSIATDIATVETTIESACDNHPCCSKWRKCNVGSRVVIPKGRIYHEHHAVRTAAPTTARVRATRARVFPSSVCTDSSSASTTEQWPFARNQVPGPTRRHAAGTSYPTQLDRIEPEGAFRWCAMGSIAFIA
jgi:hypothetical protein